MDPGEDDTNDDDDNGSAEASPEKSGHGDGGSDSQPGNRSFHASVKKNAWDHDDTYSGAQGDDFDHLLLGATQTDVQLSTLHPEQVQIFRLWQIYLENIDPLLKVTHTPTLQARIINAVSNLEGITPSLEALLFSIYCISVLSLTNQQCHDLFGSPRVELQARYHFACQQSLLNSKVLQSGSVESLTALYLYLVRLPILVIRHDSVPISNLIIQSLGLSQVTDRPSILSVHAGQRHTRRTTDGLAR